jgi:hypothetical protein
VAEGAEARAGELAAVEDRGVVARVADHRIAGLQDRADRAQVRLVAGGEDDHVLGPHPVGELALQLDVHRGGPVEQPRAGYAGPVPLQGVAGGLLDPLIRGQSKVVVGAQHDRLPALHLDDGAGLGLEDPEIGEEVALLGGFELLRPVVGPRLLEDVHRRCECARQRDPFDAGVGHALEVSHV